MRLVLAALLLLTLVGVTVAQLLNPNVPKYIPKGFLIIGKGIATYQENPLEFEPVKIAVGKIFVWIRELNDYVETDVGLLHIGEKKYRLRNITFKNMTFSANIVDRQTGAIVGRIELEFVVKAWERMWVGVIELENATYYAYIYEVKPPAVRPLLEKLPKRLKEKLQRRIGWIGRKLRDIESCIKNPRDPKCKRLLQLCKENDEKCRMLIAAYCRVFPEDSVCRKIRRIRVREIVKRALKRIREKVRIGIEEAKEKVEEHVPENVTNTTMGAIERHKRGIEEAMNKTNVTQEVVPE